MGEAGKGDTPERHPVIKRAAQIAGVGLVAGAAGYAGGELSHQQHANEGVNPPAKVGKPFTKETPSIRPEDALKPSQSPTLAGSAFSTSIAETNTPQPIATKVPKTETPEIIATPPTEEIAELRQRVLEYMNLDPDPRLKQAFDSLDPFNTSLLQRSKDQDGTYVRYQIPVLKGKDSPPIVEYKVFYDRNNTQKWFGIDVDINEQGDLGLLPVEEFLKLQKQGQSEAQLRSNAEKLFRIPQDFQSGWEKGEWREPEGEKSGNPTMLNYSIINDKSSIYYSLWSQPGLIELTIYPLSPDRNSWPGLIEKYSQPRNRGLFSRPTSN